jgi:hypothetical protein
LFRQEIIGKSGLTPTDLMHIEGRYDQWDVDASEAALEVFAHHQYLDPDELRQEIWDLINEMIVHAVLVFLSKKELDLARGRRAGAIGQRCVPVDKRDIARWFFYNSLYRNHPQLETAIKLSVPLIGIGAPADIMLSSAADSLHANLILPEQYQVANAVGAIAGSVMVAEELLVYPMLDSEGMDVVGYYVQASGERHEYDDLQDALDFARDLSRERALGAAIRSGADTPQVIVDEASDGLDTFRIRAKAIGNPRLGR